MATENEKPNIPAAPSQALWEASKYKQHAQSAAKRNVAAQNSSPGIFSRVVSGVATAVGSALKKTTTAINNLFNGTSQYWDGLKAAEIEAEERRVKQLKSGGASQADIDAAQNDVDAAKTWAPFAGGGSSGINTFIALPWATSMYDKFLDWVRGTPAHEQIAGQKDILQLEEARIKVDESKIAREEAAKAIDPAKAARDAAKQNLIQVRRKLKIPPGTTSSNYNIQLKNPVTNKIYESVYKELKEAESKAYIAEARYKGSIEKYKSAESQVKLAEENFVHREHVAKVRKEAQGNAAATTKQNEEQLKVQQVVTAEANKAEPTVLESSAAEKPKAETSATTFNDGPINAVADVIVEETDVVRAAERLTALEKQFETSSGLNFNLMAAMPFSQTVYDMVIDQITSPPYAIPLKNVREVVNSRKELSEAEAAYTKFEEALAARQVTNPNAKDLADRNKLKGVLQEKLSSYQKAQTAVIEHGELLIAQAEARLLEQQKKLDPNAALEKPANSAESNKIHLKTKSTSTLVSMIETVIKPFGYSLENLSSMRWAREVYDSAMKKISPLTYGVPASFLQERVEAEKKFDAANLAFQQQLAVVEKLQPKTGTALSRVDEVRYGEANDRLHELYNARRLAFDNYAVLESYIIDESQALIDNAKGELTKLTSQTEKLINPPARETLSLKELEEDRSKYTSPTNNGMVKPAAVQQTNNQKTSDVQSKDTPSLGK